MEVPDLDNDATLGEPARRPVDDSDVARETLAELKRADGLLHVARLLASESGIDRVLDSIAQALLDATTHTRASIALWDPAARTLTMSASRGVSPVPRGLVLAYDDASKALRQAIDTARPVLADYDAMGAGATEAGRQDASRLTLVTPIVYQGRVVGTVSADDPGESREFTSVDREIITGLVSQAAAAVELARLVDRERQATRLSAALAEVDAVVHSSLKVDEITARALAEGAAAIGAQTGAVIGIDGDGWLTWQSYNFEPSVVGVRLTNEENPHGVAAVTTGDVIAIDDAYNDPRVDNAFMKRYGIRSVIVAPVFVRGTPVAGIYYNYNSAAHHFTEQETVFVARLASSLSVALQNAHLFESERETVARSELLRAVAEVASRSLSREEIAQTVLERLAALPEFAAGAVHVVDDSGSEPVLRALAVRGYPDDMLGFMSELPVAADNNPGRLVLDGLDILTQVDDSDPAQSRSRLEHTGIADARWIVLPLRAGNRLLGTLVLIFRGERPFSEGDISVLSGVAAALGPPIANAQLFGALEETSERLATILDSIGDAFVAVDSEWRYLIVNRKAEAMLGRSAAELVGKRMDKEYADVAGWPHYLKAMRERVAVSFESYAESAHAWVEVHAYPTLDGISMIVSDITPRRAAEEALQRSRERADMLAMLLDDSSQPFMVGSPDGRFLLFNRAFEQLTGYSSAELARLKWPDDVTSPETLAAERVAIAAIDRTGEPQRFEKDFLRKDGSLVPAEVLRHGQRDADGTISYYYAFITDITERRAAEEHVAADRRLDETLAAIGAAVTSTLDSDEILHRLVQLSAEAVGAETASITLSERRGWTMKETWGMASDPEATVLMDPILGAALLDATDHQPIVVNDVAADPAVDAQVMARLGIRSLMAVPILTQQTVVGALVFHHRSAPGEFTPQHVEFARNLMSIVTLALDNARLYERERRIADTLQQAVLTEPETIPGIESAVVYQAASSTANIGGDFYDVFQLDGGLVGVEVGDVSGKGLDAARLTSLLHDGIRAFAYEDHDPASVVKRVNTLVHRLSPPEVFATVFYGVLDPATGRFTYCVAGHPHPVVVGRDGARLLEGAHSPLVGGFRDVDFAVSETVLDLGDRLVLYTDGITEARHGVEMFGEGRLVETLSKLRHTSTRLMPQRLVRATLKFAGGSLRDDTVVVCLRRSSRR